MSYTRIAASSNYLGGFAHGVALFEIVGGFGQGREVDGGRAQPLFIFGSAFLPAAQGGRLGATSMVGLYRMAGYPFIWGVRAEYIRLGNACSCARAAALIERRDSYESP